jgi:pyruvate dehydrogenase E1 component alpha subunit/2-oxoisovalerate dehydrogenase E1 component alpha subunit
VSEVRVGDGGEAMKPLPPPAANTVAGGRGPYGYFSGTDEDKARGLFQLLDQDGSCDPVAAERIDKDTALSLYRGMLTIRVVDRRMMALQRQGRIGFYGEALGQEAAVVGSAAALEKDDWLVPALREAGAGLYRGMSLSAYLAQIYGNSADNCKGRQMPCHPSDPENHYVVMSSCVSSQIPHAVGIAMAMKIRGDRGRMCIGYMGDGGTSEGDFHTALNFAGVTGAPVVLVCQNNQWAISTPGHRQTAAETIALKGIGYGVEPLRADGNDVFAVYEITRYAAEKARTGGGPTFIELLTYRVSAHSSSDDPSRYRDESITEEWKEKRDPLARCLTYLSSRGWLGQAEEEIEAKVRRTISEQEALGAPARETLFTDVFEELPWHLRQQRDDLLAE